MTSSGPPVTGYVYLTPILITSLFHYVCVAVSTCATSYNTPYKVFTQICWCLDSSAQLEATPRHSTIVAKFSDGQLAVLLVGVQMACVNCMFACVSMYVWVVCAVLRTLGSECSVV